MTSALLVACFALAQAPATPPDDGTRLLPFGEDLPARGPLPPATPTLAPPLRLAAIDFAHIPVSELTVEEREVLLRRARLDAADRGFFSEGPKNPWKAVSLSAEAVALAVVLPPLWIVAASYGELYAGNWTEALIMSGVRLGFGIWIAVEAINLLGALSNANTLSGVQTAANRFDIATGIGGTVILGTSAAELLTVFGVTERANASWEEKALAQMSLAVVPTAGGSALDGAVRF
jgi:hypothetical protein